MLAKDMQATKMYSFLHIFLVLPRLHPCVSYNVFQKLFYKWSDHILRPRLNGYSQDQHIFSIFNGHIITLNRDKDVLQWLDNT